MATPRKRPMSSPRSPLSSPKSEEKINESFDIDLFSETPTPVKIVQVEEPVMGEVMEKTEEVLPPITPMPDPGPRFLSKEDLPEPVKKETKAPGKPLTQSQKPRHPRNIPKFSRYNKP